MAAAGFLPSSFHLLSDLIDEGVNLSLIFDSCLYSKIKRDNLDKLRKLVNSQQVALYLYPRNMHLFSFKANDSCLVLRLLTNEGTYDHKQLYCCSPNAAEWGRELFEYYLKDSMPITEI
jgi:predicted transcriptional regulator